MVLSPLCQVPRDWWDALGILSPAETAQGPVNALRQPGQQGPEASVIFANRWSEKGGKRKRTPLAHETVSHPSLDISDDEGPPKLSPQKLPDFNGNLPIRSNNQEADDSKIQAMTSMDSEMKEILNGVALKLNPEAVGQIASKPTTKTKAMEFSARIMGISIPDTAHLNRGWKVRLLCGHYVTPHCNIFLLKWFNHFKT